MKGEVWLHEWLHGVCAHFAKQGYLIRADGPGCDDIIGMVKRAGFSADDLKDNINERITKRTTTTQEEIK